LAVWSHTVLLRSMFMRLSKMQKRQA